MRAPKPCALVMQIIAEDIDGAFYFDIHLGVDEIGRLNDKEMVGGAVICKRRKYYIGLYLNGALHNESKEEQEEDF